MILPHSNNAVLLLMILSLLCWGSWANFYKLAGKWRFELFYFDFAIGLMLISVICAFSVGNLGYDGFDTLDDLLNAGKRQWLYGFSASVIFNLGNMLIIAAVSVAGMAVAFPMGFGVAMIVGSLLSYVARPNANPAYMLFGCLLLLLSIVVNGVANAGRTVSDHESEARAGKAKSTERPSSLKGIILASVGGLLMGTFAPLLLKAQDPEIGLGPYALMIIFSLGVLFSTFVFNLFFMNLPVEGDPLEIVSYFHGAIGKHALGILGGMMWGGGALAAFVAATPKGEMHMLPPMSGIFAQASPILAALWGLLAWREFKGARASGKLFAGMTLVLFGGGVVALALSQFYLHKP